MINNCKICSKKFTMRTQWQKFCSGKCRTSDPDKELRNKFCSQRCAAAVRGIEFLLTFEEWLKFWLDSGKLPERGRKKGQYVMARFGDKGPYAIENIKIILCSENTNEIIMPASVLEQRSKAKKGKPISKYHSGRISESNRTRVFSNESKKKISEKLKGRKLTEEHKRNIQIEMGRIKV